MYGPRNQADRKKPSPSETAGMSTIEKWNFSPRVIHRIITERTTASSRSTSIALLFLGVRRQRLKTNSDSSALVINPINVSCLQREETGRSSALGIHCAEALGSLQEVTKRGQMVPHGYWMGADALARDAAGGVGGIEEERGSSVVRAKTTVVPPATGLPVRD